METEMRNKDTWERVRLSMVHSGVKAVFTKPGELPRMKLFASVVEARDWFRADGRWTGRV